MGLFDNSGTEFPPVPKDAAKDYEGKIVIIGAGPCGLAAAKALQHMGVKNYIVLEATDRIGGRLKMTDTFHDEIPLDLGAEWIHSPNEKIVGDMLAFGDEEDGNSTRNTGASEPSEYIKYRPRIFLRKKEAKFLSWMYGEVKWKSSTWWHWLDENAHRFVKDMVHLNSPVQKIQYDTGTINTNDFSEETKKVKVILNNGEVYKADKVICTIPLAMLKKFGSKMFEPALPKKKLNALNKVEMPAGMKIIFEMKEKFYPDETLDNTFLGALRDGNDLCAMYDALYEKDLSLNPGKNMMCFIAVGQRQAGELAKLPEEELIKAVLAKIDEVFDGKGSKNYANHIVQNWTQEPFVQGAYSFPCKKKYIHDIRETVDGKILFAGEHTSIKFQQLVQGAVMEGRRAAVEAALGRII